MKRLLISKHIKLNTMVLYILCVIIFALVYKYAMTVDDFNWPEADTTRKRTFLDYVYFSSTTLATVGYGDITPKSQRCRALVIAQQSLSVFILTLLMV